MFEGKNKCLKENTTISKLRKSKPNPIINVSKDALSNALDILDQDTSLMH